MIAREPAAIGSPSRARRTRALAPEILRRIARRPGFKIAMAGRLFSGERSTGGRHIFAYLLQMICADIAPRGSALVHRLVRSEA